MSSEYGRGKGFNFFIAEVTDIDSPYQDGSVRCRAYGTEDNTSAIPDDKLRWYKTAMPVTSGQVSGAAGIHNMQKGTKALCMYADDDEQIPIVLFTLTSSGVASSLPKPETIGTPISSRPDGDPRPLDGVKGGEKLHSFIDSAKSLYDMSLNEAGGKAAKKAKEPTIGTKEFDKAKSALEFTKKFDPKNLAGSVPQSLDMLKQLQSKMGSGAPQMISKMLGPKISGLLKQIPALQQLGNLDMLNQVQGMLTQELAKLPIPPVQQAVQSVETVNKQLTAIKELPSKTDIV